MIYYISSILTLYQRVQKKSLKVLGLWEKTKIFLDNSKEIMDSFEKFRSQYILMIVMENIDRAEKAIKYTTAKHSTSYRKEKLSDSSYFQFCTFHQY